MTGFVMFLHAFISVLLMVIILMQSGRGGGLTEGFASAESMFGAKTNEFMIKATTVVASLFLITCLGLAVLSSQKGKSLMSTKTAPETLQTPPIQADGTFVDEISDEAPDSEIPAAAIAEPITETPSNDFPASVIPENQ